MDEFSSTLCSQDAVAGDKQYVLCNMYVSPRAHPDSAARRESAAFFAPPAPVVIAQAAAAVATKRPAPLQGPELPCPKRMRGAVVAPTPPFRQPAGYCTATAPFAPPPPHAIASSAQTLPPAPTHFATPQPLPPVPTRLAAPPSRWPAPAPPQHPKQHMPPPPLPVVRACHVPVVQAPAGHCPPQPSEKTKQRTRDPFEAFQQRNEAEEVVAAPDPKKLPAALDWDEIELQNITSLLNEIPDAVAVPDPASKEEPPAALQDDDFDELCHALEEIIPTTEFSNDF
ncbi:unnamed protein product [Urochloa humidicola]